MGRQSGMILVSFITAHVALILFIISLSTHYWIQGTTHYHLNVTTPKNDSMKPHGEFQHTNNHTSNNHTSKNNHTIITLFNVTRTCYKGFWKICCHEETSMWYNHTHNHTIEVSQVVKLPIYEVISNQTNNHSVNWTGCHDVHVMNKNTTSWFRVAMFCCAFGVANVIVGNVLMYLFLLVTKFKRSFPIVLITTVVYFVATAELVVSVLMINIHHHQDTDFTAFYSTSLDWSVFVAIAGICLAAVCTLTSLGLTIVVKATAAPYETLTQSSIQT